MAKAKLPFSARLVISFTDDYVGAGVWVDGQGGRDLTDGKFTRATCERVVKDVQHWCDELLQMADNPAPPRKLLARQR